LRGWNASGASVFSFRWMTSERATPHFRICCELPINEVKIDRSFVESLLMDEEGYAMVRSILHMANSLNLSVVAEGIERDEQWQTLKALGCKAFQGYLFSRPKSPRHPGRDTAEGF